ncbi:hypothetical protein ABPG72_017755 [Tetrahymena utriculariae]
MNSNEVIIKLIEKIARLDIKYNDKQVQLEQMIIDQSNQKGLIKDLVKIIKVLKVDQEKQIESLKIGHKNQIEELKNEILELNKEIQQIKKLIPNIFSKIIKQKELQMIKKWISDQQINLELIYRATADGFEVQKIYEKCQDKSKVIMLKETNQNRRFGFYTDLFIKSYNAIFISQNPNSIFLFSLDLQQKYTSNESNFQYAFYSNYSFLAVGGGSNIRLYDNSNQNNDSYVNNISYGKKKDLQEMLQMEEDSILRQFNMSLNKMLGIFVLEFDVTTVKIKLKQYILQIVIFHHQNRRNQDQIVLQKQQDEHESLQSSFQFSFQGKAYIASLQVIDYRLEITVMIEEQSHFQ